MDDDTELNTRFSPRRRDRGARRLPALRRCDVRRRDVDARATASSPPSACSRPSSRRGASSKSFDPERELRPWLATITRRVAVDIYRREARTRSEPRADVDDTVVPIAFERTWEAFEVRAALDQLPGDEREVVRLAHFEGLTHSEIADKLRRARRDGEVAVVPRPPATGRPVVAPRGRGAVMVVVAQTASPPRFVPCDERAPRPR